jgi:hypothetical protein
MKAIRGSDRLGEAGNISDGSIIFGVGTFSGCFVLNDGD